MGLSENQKILAAIEMVGKINDIDLLIPLLNATHDRINEIVEAYNEDIQE